MTYRSYFGSQNSTLGSVVPLAMFVLREFVGAWDGVMVIITFTGHVGMMEAIGEELMAVKWIIICNERRCVPVFTYVKCF